MTMTEHETKHGDDLGMSPVKQHWLPVHEAGPEERKKICAVLNVPVGQNLYNIASTVVLHHEE